MTGVISTCTFHSCPEIRGCTGMDRTASEILTGRRPSFTTLAKPSPTGTVQTSSDGAFQLPGYYLVPEAPALVEEERGDGLQVHLVSVKPTMLPANRPPLLGKHAKKPLLREVAYHDSGPKLVFTLASELRGRGREDCGRSPLRESSCPSAQAIAIPAESDRPARRSRANSLGAVSCGTMLYKGITGRVIRFQVFGKAHWHTRAGNSSCYSTGRCSARSC